MATINVTATIAEIPPAPTLEDQAQGLRAERLRDGLCPHCGTRLYETVRTGVLRKKVTRPLSIAGQVVRGQCVQCLNHGDDNAAAVALAAIEEPPPSSGGTPSDDIPNVTATPLPSSATIQLDATYTGEYNNFGERHGEGTLVWANGDRYKGSFWNGVREGEGSLHFSDGSEYVGCWKDNKMHGQGECVVFVRLKDFEE
jgi:hypothetical protein